jgi:hypothetical protein
MDGSTATSRGVGLLSTHLVPIVTGLVRQPGSTKQCR